MTPAFLCTLQEATLTQIQPGEEGIWLKENMAYFKEQADVHEDEDIRDMLKELGEREDLKKLME
jgi:hypothetical protein